MTGSSHSRTPYSLAMATRLSTGDIDVDEAAELMIDLFWHGLRGAPEDREAAAGADGSNAAVG